ncbi:MAG: UDP-3-O-(3-hydroxymyristoyl)glucosamine N-acyltransferase, partial [Gammaproteobacteria bacterium]|nr:UDP-3-O-(3-hydroxymyristoyl)glucosamine N-acyltransferase [Gammaproteobacteria bacterium]
MTNAKTYTLGTLAELLQVELIGDGDCEISGLATLQHSEPGKLSFLSNPSYASQLSGCKATAVIVAPEFVDSCPTNKLVSESPYVTFAKASQLFDNRSVPSNTIHHSAVIHDSAKLADNVSVGPNVVIEADVSIGSGSVLGPGCVLARGCQLGEECRLGANVTLYHEVVLGDNVIVHSGAVLGADGFGFAFDGEKSIKIAQLGAVHIGDDVEIGAGTTIDRGALENTIIEQGVKIDNQVQIG